MRGLPSLADFPVSFLTAVAVPLGLVLGSFLNVVIHRLPRGESLVFPGSHCPVCRQPIRVRDNVPVLGFLLLRGRARCCGTAIPIRYPLVEIVGGLLAWAILSTIVQNLDPETSIAEAGLIFAVYLALGLGLVAAAFIDLDHMFLPDGITLGGAVLGLATVSIRNEVTLIDSLVGAAVGFLVIWLPFIVIHQAIRGRPGMGLGDAKLLALAGAWFGWVGAVFALLAGAVQATAVMLVLLVTGTKPGEPQTVVEERRALREAIEQAEGEERKALEQEREADPLGADPEPGFGALRVAFGPFLALAILEFMLFGAWIRAELLGGIVP
jgi:leader peptidase (prepilin peptidase)/N-methyltransferase